MKSFDPKRSKAVSGRFPSISLRTAIPSIQAPTQVTWSVFLKSWGRFCLPRQRAFKYYAWCRMPSIADGADIAFLGLLPAFAGARLAGRSGELYSAAVVGQPVSAPFSGASSVGVSRAPRAPPFPLTRRRILHPNWRPSTPFRHRFCRPAKAVSAGRPVALRPRPFRAAGPCTQV